MCNTYWMCKKSLHSFSPCDCLCNNLHNDKNIFSILSFFWNQAPWFYSAVQTEMGLETVSSGNWIWERKSTTLDNKVLILSRLTFLNNLSCGLFRPEVTQNISYPLKSTYLDCHLNITLIYRRAQRWPCMTSLRALTYTHQNKINIWDFGVIQRDASSNNVHIFFQNNTCGKTRQGMCQFNFSTPLSLPQMKQRSSPLTRLQPSSGNSWRLREDHLLCAPNVPQWCSPNTTLIFIISKSEFTFVGLTTDERHGRLVLWNNLCFYSFVSRVVLLCLPSPGQSRNVLLVLKLVIDLAASLFHSTSRKEVQRRVRQGALMRPEGTH